MATHEELTAGARKALAAGDYAAVEYFDSQIKNLQGQNSAVPAQQPKPSFGRRAADFAGNLAQGAMGSAAGIGSNLISAGTFLPRKLVKATGLADDGMGKDMVDQVERIPGRVREFQKDAKGVGGFVGSLAGDIAGTAGLMGVGRTALNAGARHLPQALSRTRAALTSAPAVAAAEGAIGAAALAPEDHLKHAAGGAIGGAVGQQVLSRTLGRIADPTRISKYGDTEALMNEGVPMTVGLGANPNSWSGRAMRFIEESAAGVPLVGAGIKAQREAARQAFREVPMRQVASEAVVQMPARSPGTTTADLLEQLRGNVGAKYDALLDGKVIQRSNVLEHNLNTIVDNPKLSMTEADRKAVRNLVEAHIWDRSNSASGSLTHFDVPAIFKAQSDLRQLGFKASKSPLSSEQARGQALTDSANEIYSFIQRRFPNIGQQLQDLRAPNTTINTIASAANKAGARGEFTPMQLGKSAIPRRDHGMQHLAAVAEPLLTKDPSAMGATARTALILAGSHLLTGGAAPIIAPGIALGLGTRTGQKTLTGQLKWQKALADALERNPDAVNQISGMLGREVGTRMVGN